MSSRVEPPPHSATAAAPILAPHSQEAEEALIGSMLIDPREFKIVSATLAHSHFFFIQNAFVWEAMTAIHERGDEIDFVTVVSELKLANKPAPNDSWPAYLGYCTAQATTAINAPSYARTVSAAYTRRQQLEVANEIALIARDTDITAAQAYAKGLTLYESIAPSYLNNTGLQDADELASSIVELAGSMVDNPEARPSLPTGYLDLDNIIGGIHRGELTVVGARPGMGKSIFLGQLAWQMADHYNGHYLQLEMTSQQVTQRWISADAGLPSHLWTHNGMTSADLDLVVASANRLATKRLTIDDTPSLTIRQLAAKAHQQMSISPFDVLFVDYLQLIQDDSTYRNLNHTEQVALKGEGLKALAKELDIAVVAAAQVTRAVEGREDKRPMMGDIAESDRVTQAAGLILTLYRDDYYFPDTSERPNEIDVIIAKNRLGPTGQVTMLFNKELQRLNNLSRRMINLNEPVNFDDL